MGSKKNNRPRKQNKRNVKRNRRNLEKRNQKPIFQPIEKEIRSLNTLMEYVNQKDLAKDDYFLNGEDVLYIPYYKSLPSELVKQIDNHIKKYPIRKGRCYNNSTNLTLNIDGVKTIHGWYSYNIYKERESLKSENIESPYLNELIEFVEKNQDVEFIKVGSNNNDQDSNIIDTRTGQMWFRHCWNSYNGIQFDITREFIDLRKDLFQKKKWMKYRKIIDFDKSYYVEEFQRRGLGGLPSKHTYSTLLSGSGDFSNPNENHNYPILNNYRMVS